MVYGRGHSSAHMCSKQATPVLLTSLINQIAASTAFPLSVSVCPMSASVPLTRTRKPLLLYEHLQLGGRDLYRAHAQRPRKFYQAALGTKDHQPLAFTIWHALSKLQSRMLHVYLNVHVFRWISCVTSLLTVCLSLTTRSMPCQYCKPHKIEGCGWQN